MANTLNAADNAKRKVVADVVRMNGGGIVSKEMVAAKLNSAASSLRSLEQFTDKKDDMLALAIYEKAGDLGSGSAMAAAGAMYCMGYGIEKDSVKAEACYAKAVELADKDASL